MKFWQLLLFCAFSVFAQPRPNEIYREFFADGMRVGGHQDYGGHDIRLAHRITLDDALRAEVQIEQLLCHDGTRGLAISLNGNEWITFPEADSIQKPVHQYQYKTYPTVAIPLSQFYKGTGNKFRLKVDETEGWWPQNILKGVTFRIYYKSGAKNIVHAEGKIIAPVSGSAISNNPVIKVDASGVGKFKIKQVDFIACYKDVDYDGDGVFYDWQFHPDKGNISHHLGTVTEPPYHLRWNTSWVPDQDRPIKIMARIVLKGWSQDTFPAMSMTDVADNITFKPAGSSVSLIVSDSVPQRWVTRNGERSQWFDIKKGIKADSLQIVWSSWSPCYSQGVLLNETQIWTAAKDVDPCYEDAFMRITVNNNSILKSGKNSITTAHPTGKGNHGMEVNWPGFQILVKSSK